ncbi:MAG: hypothetical protein ACT4PT_00730, partial [Methanobacteriota archaeon]
DAGERPTRAPSRGYAVQAFVVETAGAEERGIRLVGGSPFRRVGDAIVLSDATVVLGEQTDAFLGSDVEGGHGATEIRIERSRVEAPVPGFGGQIRGAWRSLVVRDSTLVGLHLEDLAFDSVVIENSTISGSYFTPNARSRVRIADSTLDLAFGFAFLGPAEVDVRGSTFLPTLVPAFFGTVGAPSSIVDNVFLGTMYGPSVLLGASEEAAAVRVERNVFARSLWGLGGDAHLVTGGNDFIDVREPAARRSSETGQDPDFFGADDASPLAGASRPHRGVPPDRVALLGPPVFLPGRAQTPPEPDRPLEDAGDVPRAKAPDGGLVVVLLGVAGALAVASRHGAVRERSASVGPTRRRRGGPR